MANFTELTALEYTIENIKTALENGDMPEFDTACIEKLEKMRDSRKKNRNSAGSYANSKQAREVKERMASVLGYLLNQSEPLTNRAIGGAVPGFLGADGSVSTRRVTASLSKLEKQGYVEKTGKDKAGYTLYQATEKAHAEWEMRQVA